MVEAKKLSFAFPNGDPVINRIDWQSRLGQIEALVGPNGAGKTTLLRLLSGELKPTAGSITFENQSLSRWSAEELATRRALLTQSPRLDFAFSVREVVAMGRAPHHERIERKQDDEIIEAVIAELDLAALASRPFPSLSRGEKQRVQLARVLAQIDGPEGQPKRHLFLDEPVNHLDLAHQHLTLSLARRRAERGHAVVVVLHDLNLALRYTDQVTMLDHGCQIARGAPEEIFEPDRLRKVFGVEATVHTTANGRRVLDIEGVRTPNAPAS